MLKQMGMATGNYKVMIERGGRKINNYVGVLVGDQTFRKIIQNKAAYENVNFYEEAAKEKGVGLCYFRLKDIQPGLKKVNVCVCSEDGTFIQTYVTKPLVIHNRIFTNKQFEKNKIKQLKQEGVRFFNENNRYKKSEIYEILQQDDELINHLPHTVLANKENISMMMGVYKELILKPDNGSSGFGVLQLKQVSKKNWELQYVEKKMLVKKNFSRNWPRKLKELLSHKNTIIQERIKLPEYNGRPFDMRVSVQKNGKGKWQVSGMVGKVAKKGAFATNVAQGGKCYPMKEIIQKYDISDYGSLTEKVHDFSLKVVKQLEKSLPEISDLGLDIGLTEEGRPMLIECNGRDLRITFRNANMMEEWKATHMTPIHYANYLLKINK